MSHRITHYERILMQEKLFEHPVIPYDGRLITLGTNSIIRELDNEIKDEPEVYDHSLEKPHCYFPTSYSNSKFLKFIVSFLLMDYSSKPEEIKNILMPSVPVIGAVGEDT